MIAWRVAVVALATCALTSLNACGVGGFGVTDLRKDIARAGLSVDASVTVNRLTASQPESANIIDNAQALLIFPQIIKGGLGVGVASGKGVWQEDGKNQGYYQSTAASYGLQAGLQKHGYALFLMDDAAIRSLNASDGWELGSAPNLVVIDKGAAGSLSTTTLNKGTYAVFFNQKGLMAGLGLQGTKVTRLSVQP